MTWDEAAAYALALPGAVPGTHYGQPAVKANGHAFLNTGNEPDTSFVVHLDVGVIEWLLAGHPAIFWQSAHYVGHRAVLVRHDSDDNDLVGEMIVSAHARAVAKKPPRARR